MKAPEVSGIFLARPPMSFSSLLWTAWMMLPAPRNSRALKKAWVVVEVPAHQAARAQRRDHVPELGASAVGQDLLDVGLCDGDDGGEDRCGSRR